MRVVWPFGAHVRDELSAFLDGELDQATRQAVDDHLARCAACRSELEGLERTRDRLRAVRPVEVPRALARPAAAGAPQPAAPTAVSARSAPPPAAAAAATTAPAAQAPSAARPAGEVAPSAPRPSAPFPTKPAAAAPPQVAAPARPAEAPA